jgi:hypothetical protein
MKRIDKRKQSRKARVKQSRLAKKRETPLLDNLKELTISYIPIDLLEHSKDGVSANPKKEKTCRQSDFYKQIRDSIKEHGMINPIIAYPNKNKDGKHKIGIGNNRWLAAKELGIKEVPVHFGNYNRYELIGIKKFYHES